MRNRSSIILLVAMLALLVTMGCSVSQLVGKRPPTPTPTFTKTPKPTFTPTPVYTPTPVPTNTPVPTDTPAVTPTPTDTPQPTPTPMPQAIVKLADLNYRAGPSTSYASLGRLSIGYVLEVRKRTADSAWLRVCCLNNQEGWVASQYVDLSVPMDAVPIDETVPPTPTPRPRPPTNTPAPTLPPAPTNTPAPQFAFSYVQGSMAAAPNCGTVYFKGKVVDAAGNPMNGVTVELEFFGNRVYRVSGEGEGPGEWGFAPLSMEMYKTRIPFHIRLVQSASNPQQLSNIVTIDFEDCAKAGQFTNITFRKN